MKEQLEKLAQESLEAVAAAADVAALDALRVKYLGKKGELTALLKQMGKLSPEERPVMGQLANSVRARLRRPSTAAASRWRRPRWRLSSRPRLWTSPSPASASRAGTSTRWTS